MSQSNTSVFSRHPLIVEAAACVFGALFLGYVASEYNAFESIYQLTRDHQEYELETLIDFFLAMPALVLIFSIRRVLELKREVKRRQLAEEENLTLARTDPLTGLPNRRYFTEEMARRAERVRRRGGGIAILHLDLDHFKYINDTLGHAAGDEVLRRVSKLVQGALRREDLVARIGGDEFLIVCDMANGQPDIEALASKLVHMLTEPILYEGTPCRLGASIGIAFQTEEKETIDLDIDRLIMNADIALYRAKEKGRGRFEIFTDDLRSDFEKRKALTDELSEAIEREQFEPHYQLQFDAMTQEIVGAEALARWHHPRRGLLSPADFLSIADNGEVTAKIDALILQETLKDQKRHGFVQAGVQHLAINVSARSLMDDRLLEILRSAEFDPSSILLELSEAAIFNVLNPDAETRLGKIKELGINIEIDDFGTHNASFSSLFSIKPCRIKIDRSLVSPVVTSMKHRQLIKAIVAIARPLGIRVVAKGVETMEHARIATLLGCDFVQGYALAPPMTAHDLANFVQKARSKSFDKNTVSPMFAELQAAAHQKGLIG